MTIEQIMTSELAEIVRKLVEQGLTFRATPGDEGTWTIELLGGY
jgi:hypothetical protein